MLNCSLKLMLRARSLSKLREGMMTTTTNMAKRKTNHLMALILILTPTTPTQIVQARIAPAQTVPAPIAQALTAPAQTAPVLTAQARIAQALTARVRIALTQIHPIRTLPHQLLPTQTLPLMTAAAPQVRMNLGWLSRAQLPNSLRTISLTSPKWPPSLC